MKKAKYLVLLALIGCSSEPTPEKFINSCIKKINLDIENKLSNEDAETLAKSVKVSLVGVDNAKILESSKIKKGIYKIDFTVEHEIDLSGFGDNTPIKRILPAMCAVNLDTNQVEGAMHFTE